MKQFFERAVRLPFHADEIKPYQEALADWCNTRNVVWDNADTPFRTYREFLISAIRVMLTTDAVQGTYVAVNGLILIDNYGRNGMASKLLDYTAEGEFPVMGFYYMRECEY